MFPTLFSFFRAIVKYHHAELGDKTKVKIVSNLCFYNKAVEDVEGWWHLKTPWVHSHNSWATKSELRV